MDFGLIVTPAAFLRLSPSTQAELRQNFLGNSSAPSSENGSVVAADAVDDDDPPADLSVAQARRFVDGCRDKTKTALRVIASSPSPTFRLAAIANELRVEPDSLAGVWSGLTKRTRTILGDREAYLIAWAEEGIEDNQGRYVDHEGYVSGVTYRSLRKIFNIA